MNIIPRAILFISCLAAAVSATAQPGSVGIETGFVSSINGNAFLYTTNGHVLPTSTIQLQYPDADGKIACCIRVQGRALDASNQSSQPVSDALFGRPIFRYRFTSFPTRLKGNPFVGAAVIGAGSLKVDTTSTGAILHVDGGIAANAFTVQVCQGSEGSNLFLIADGKLKAQIYYSFGYDVMVTCDPKLFALPTSP